jgi:Uma2 family endonuclease
MLVEEELESQVLEAPVKAPSLLAPRYEGKRLTLAQFQAWQPEPDGWKYEWEHGFIVSGEEYMQKTQWFIVNNIIRTFTKTISYTQGDCLMPETDVVLERTNTQRRPDIAYLTKEQIQAGARGENPVPAFVIEIVSKHDNGSKLERKVQEYFSAGVLVVWYVYAEVGMVRVFTSAKHSDTLTDDEVCSAAPALPDFSMKVSEIFAA